LITLIRRYYLASSRELKRLDAVSRSPIYAWFSESLAGLSTIRAFNQQLVFIAKNENYLDRNQMCYLPSTSVNRWLAVRLELVGATIILVTVLLAVTALITTGVDAGLVGLVLSYALSTTGSLVSVPMNMRYYHYPFAHKSQNWLVRSASEVEQNIVSVERILHYVELPSEAPNEVPETKPADLWPSRGEVEFWCVMIWTYVCSFAEVSSPDSQYSCRYRPELSLVLKDVSMIIVRSEYIAILFGVLNCLCRNPEKKSVYVAELEPGSLRYVMGSYPCAMRLTCTLVAAGPFSHNRTRKWNDIN
jgi:ATP-binding cassette, subfamily C (CFTR/MRP), member 1